jgi:FkbM family methyltransferase
VNDSVPFVSYAQHGEDVILWRALGDRGPGSYIDVGAFHPTDDSVTQALYERGWRGINIEPQPDRLAAFERERPQDTNLCLAIGDQDGTATLTIPRNTGWASTARLPLDVDDDEVTIAIDVPARRLDTLLTELGIDDVDVLNIDVEGAEVAVVRGLLDGPVRPSVCVVAGVAPGIGRAAGDEAVALLVEAGYEHCLFDGLNHYLTADPDLAADLSMPANPLDGYTTAHLVRTERHWHELNATIAALAAENLALREAAAPPAEAEKTETSLAAAEAAADEDEPAPSFGGGDLPVPTPGAATPLKVLALPPEVPAPRPAGGSVDAELRRTRRRTTFARTLQDAPSPLPRQSSDQRVTGLLKLAVNEFSPGDAVSVLYREILGREADPDGLATWSRRIESGEPMLRLAREIADSDEALACAIERRSHVRSQLALWQNLVAVTELGAVPCHPERAYSPEAVAHEVFVGALFEVALQRAPSPDEAAFEVARLVAGAGRARLLRGYAARPELQDRLLGQPTRRLRGRLRRLLDRRHLAATFRGMVAAAETRRVAQLIADTRAEGVPNDLLGRIPTRRSQET